MTLSKATIVFLFNLWSLFVPLQTFYSQVSSPLLRRIIIQFPEDSVSDVTQNRFDKYFGGSELVVAGKVLPSESNTLSSVTTASAVSKTLSRSSESPSGV